MTLSVRASRTIRDKNRERIRNRIIAATRELIEANGFVALSADDIAAKAEVGRATFFRYFDSKEAVVAVGFFERTLRTIVNEIQRAPQGMGPVEAVAFAFRSGLSISEDQKSWVVLQSRLARDSPALKARIMEYPSHFEQAIAQAAAPRYRDLMECDIRPRLLAATAVAVFRMCSDHWGDGDQSLLGDSLMTECFQHLARGLADKQ